MRFLAYTDRGGLPVAVEDAVDARDAVARARAERPGQKVISLSVHHPERRRWEDCSVLLREIEQP